MIRQTLEEIARATRGRLSVQASAGQVVTGPVVVDSRLVVPGSLFVALPGERVDGHDYAAAAVAAGAVAVLAARDVAVPAVLVDDPREGLGRLARAVCDRLPNLTVIGITGSSGKTSTKDLLAHLLAGLGPTVAPQNSFNNEIGVPLTALQSTEQTRFLISEMGARQPGNIAYLCAVTPPGIAVVLNVGAAHLGEFGTVDVTARTKGELPESLSPDGVAVLSADDPLVRAMAARTRGRVLLFGRSPDADVRATDVRLDARARAGFTLATASGSAPVSLLLHGEHHVANALAAAAVALEAGLTLSRIAELLSSATPASRWRMAVQERPDGVVVVNDSYNANPDSVQAALRAVAVMGDGRRTWAVLGEMLELGEASEAEHERLGRLAVELGICRVIAVGPGARPLVAWSEAASRLGAGAGAARCEYAADPDAALRLLGAELAPGDVVLVKASRGIGLDRLATALLAGGEERPGAALTDDRPIAVQDGGRTDAGTASSVGGEVTA